MHELMDVIRALRGRKRIIAALVLFGGLAAVMVPAHASTKTKRYQASAGVSVATGDARRGQKQLNAGVVALEVTSTDVVKRAAAILKFDQPAENLLPSVSAVVDQKSGTVNITGQSNKASRAADIANAFARAIVDVLSAQKRADYKAQVTAAAKQLKPLQAEISALDKKIGGGPFKASTALRIQRDTKTRQYTTVYNDYQDLVSQGAPSPDVAIIQTALPGAASADPRTVGIPNSRKWRLALGMFLGLMLGGVVAIGIERFDLRVRSRSQCEEAFGLPVLSEIPRMSRRRRKKEPTIAAAPRSMIAASYRLVRAGLTLRSADSVMVTATDHPSIPHSPVVIVTSARAKEGRSTVAANIAVIFAETGAAVVAASADLRNPALHRILGVPAEPGLVQAVEGEALADAIHPTAIANLMAVPSGGALPNPGSVLSSPPALDALRSIRRNADVTVVDTPSLLQASDATPLFEMASAVVVVAKAGVTKFEEAGRAGEFLRFLKVPGAGVVLIGTRRYRPAWTMPHPWRAVHALLELRAAGKQAAMPNEESSAADPTEDTREGAHETTVAEILVAVDPDALVADGLAERPLETTVAEEPLEVEPVTAVAETPDEADIEPTVAEVTVALEQDVTHEDVPIETALDTLVVNGSLEDEPETTVDGVVAEPEPEITVEDVPRELEHTITLEEVIAETEAEARVAEIPVEAEAEPAGAEAPAELEQEIIVGDVPVERALETIVANDSIPDEPEPTVSDDIIEREPEITVEDVPVELELAITLESGPVEAEAEPAVAEIPGDVEAGPVDAEVTADLEQDITVGDVSIEIALDEMVANGSLKDEVDPTVADGIVELEPETVAGVEPEAAAVPDEAAVVIALDGVLAEPDAIDDDVLIGVYPLEPGYSNGNGGNGVHADPSPAVIDVRSENEAPTDPQPKPNGTIGDWWLARAIEDTGEDA